MNGSPHASSRLVLAISVLAMAGCELVAGIGNRSVDLANPGSGAAGAGGSVAVGGAGGAAGGGGGGMPLMCAAPITNIVGDCDLLSQDCPMGQWCDVVTIGEEPSSACVPRGGGSGAPGSECLGHDECDGARCINNRCAPFCCPVSDEPCGGEGTCNLTLTFGAEHSVMTCSYAESCTLLEDTCPTGLSCHIEDDGPAAVCDYPSSSVVDEGEACENRNDCGESQICNKLSPDGSGTQGTCRQLCDLNDWMTSDVPTGGCPPDRECTVFGAPAHPAHVGMCQPL